MSCFPSGSSPLDPTITSKGTTPELGETLNIEVGGRFGVGGKVPPQDAKVAVPKTTAAAAKVIPFLTPFPILQTVSTKLFFMFFTRVQIL